MTSDRIEKQIVLSAPLSKVWHAITNAQAFGTWFGIEVLGEFLPGAAITARINTPGYEHLTMSFTIERIEPQRLFSYRWHPYAVDPNVDYSQEPTTLIEFQLAEVAGGTLLTVVESGFDQLPAERRDVCLHLNAEGWSQQIVNIERYVAA